MNTTEPLTTDQQKAIVKAYPRLSAEQAAERVRKLDECIAELPLTTQVYFDRLIKEIVHEIPYNFGPAGAKELIFECILKGYDWTTKETK